MFLPRDRKIRKVSDLAFEEPVEVHAARMDDRMGPPNSVSVAEVPGRADHPECGPEKVGTWVGGALNIAFAVLLSVGLMVAFVLYWLERQA